MSKASMPELADAAMPAVWASLTDDSGADIAIISGDGFVRWVRTPVSWWALRIPADEAVGKTIHDVFTKEIADERMDLVRRAISTNKPILVHGIWRGVRTRTTIRPLPMHGGHEQRVLVICRGPIPSDRGAPTRGDAEVVHARFVDPGQLGKLTPRELEILGMIAQGMTTAAIAKKLFRSRKTIEAHRLSMGAKLGVRNRVELARIALEAGLLSAQVGTVEPMAAAPRSV